MGPAIYFGLSTLITRRNTANVRYYRIILTSATEVYNYPN